MTRDGASATLGEALAAVASGEATGDRYTVYPCGCVEVRNYFRDRKGFESYLARWGRRCLFHRCAKP